MKLSEPMELPVPLHLKLKMSVHSPANSSEPVIDATSKEPAATVPAVPTLRTNLCRGQSFKSFSLQLLIG